MSAEGLLHDGKIYRLHFEPNLTANQSRKGTRKLSINGETHIRVRSESRSIPENSNGNRLREEYYKLRNEYVDKHIEIESGLNETTTETSLQKETTSNIQNIRIETTSKKTSFNDFFQANKEILKGEPVWINGQRWDFININENWTLQMKKVVWNGEKPEYRSISSFKQLYEMGQINGFPDQNTTNGNKYTLSRAESNRHKLYTEMINGEKAYLESIRGITSSENLPVKATTDENLPALRETISKALVVINKQGGLPAVIEKQGGLPAIMEKNGHKGIIPPYWLIPLLIIPGLHWWEGDPIAPTMSISETIKSTIEDIEKNPDKYWVELDSDITGPFDQRADINLIQQSIDSNFSSMLAESQISDPLEDNAVIILRGVASWTYQGSWDKKEYNEALALRRVDEFKKYLMQKHPNLTEDNFILGSFYQLEALDEAKRFQGVSMWVVDVQKYGGIEEIKALYQNQQITAPSGEEWRVI